MRMVLPRKVLSSRLCAGAQHHATKEITRDPAAVVVRVHTHSALRPPSNSSDSETVQGRKQPGITLRDIRFAYLLDELNRQPT